MCITEDYHSLIIGSTGAGKTRRLLLPSAMNYALRSQDHSYVSEEALMGTCRSYYPRSNLLFLGENIPPKLIPLIILPRIAI